ncbi:MAG: DUF502 domain-containing protein [Alphaproteobacteria bacterium]|nr:MAG: DUF502 domain-containing protein [Alphaproteobacteria bacterium]
MVSTDSSAARVSLMARFQRYVLAGALSLVPLWVTWLVCSLLFDFLLQVGRPGVAALARLLHPSHPLLAEALQEPMFQGVMALLVVVLALYLLGWITTHVVGQKLMGAFDRVMEGIPLVKKIYGAMRKLVLALEQKPDGHSWKVVLIDFPYPGVKAVGFVTRMLTNTQGGPPLATVFVPTAPNPSSGYLEILPMDRLTVMDWTFEEAMRYVVSGGVVGPDHVSFKPSVPAL